MKLNVIHNNQIKQIEKSNINAIQLIASSHDTNKVALVNMAGEKVEIAYKRPILLNISGCYQNNDNYENKVETFANDLNLFYNKDFSGMIINLDNVKKIKQSPYTTVKRDGFAVGIIFNDNSKIYIYAKNNEKSKLIIKKLIAKFEKTKNNEKSKAI